MVTRLAALAVALVVVGSCGDSGDAPDESSPSWSPDSSRIAFAFDGDIYVMNADGSGRTNLTDSLDADTQPIWSPDGERIVFLSQRQGLANIRSVRPDGTGQANLTNFPASYLDLAWSRDGTKIAFATDRDRRSSGLGQALETRSQEGGPPKPAELGSELYVMNADGTGQTRLTFNQAFDGNPTWSQDGTKVAFQSNRDGDHEIYVINVDGTGLTQLTDNTRADVVPAWSPDGRHIAFASNRPQTEFRSEFDRERGIYFMNPDGTEQLNLTDTIGIAFTSPSWSPDSRYLAFDGRYTSIRGGGNNEIYAMRMEGLYTFSSLTNNPDLYTGPVAWSPNGKLIAFISRRTGKGRVHVLEVRDSDTLAASPQ